MTIRLPLVCLTAAWLLWLASPPRASAKPPDLPHNPTILCQSGSASAADPDSGPWAEPTAREETPALLEGLSAVLNGFCGRLMELVDLCGCCLEECPCTAATKVATRPSGPACCCECRTDKQSNTGKHGRVVLSLGVQSALNVEMKLGVTTRRLGCCEMELTLPGHCPGLCSACAACTAALGRLVLPAAACADPPMSGAEESSCPYCRQKTACPAARSDCLLCDVLENLAKLEHAQRLYEKAEGCRAAGCEEEARSLYRKVQEMCPGSRYAHQAAEQLQILTTARTAEKETAEEQESAPMLRKKAAPGRSPCCPGGDSQALHLRLPAVDARVVDALEKLLAEVEGTGAMQLAVQVEPAAGKEEQEAAPPPAKVQIRILYLEPGKGKLILRPSKP